MCVYIHTYVSSELLQVARTAQGTLIGKTLQERKGTANRLPMRFFAILVQSTCGLRFELRGLV